MPSSSPQQTQSETYRWHRRCIGHGPSCLGRKVLGPHELNSRKTLEKELTEASTWTFKMAKIMDPVLPLLSIWGYRAVILGSLEVQLVLSAFPRRRCLAAPMRGGAVGAGVRPVSCCRKSPNLCHCFPRALHTIGMYHIVYQSLF